MPCFSNSFSVWSRNRASSAAIVRLQTTVDALQHSLDARLGAIESRLSQDDRAPRR